MIAFIKSKKIILSLCLLILAISISGCSKNFIEQKNKNNFMQLEGHIYAKTMDIPSEATVTLSITPLLIEENTKPDSLNYQFTTKNASRTAEFKMAIPKSLYHKGQWGISTRVEKSNQLIMMSSEITPLPEKASDKVILTVISN